MNTSGLTAVSTTITAIATRCTSLRYGGSNKRIANVGASTGFTVAPAATGNLGFSGALTIGNYDGGGFNWPGYIAEFLLYKRNLSDTEHTLIEGYLRNKYALNWGAKPLYIFEGDSLTTGYRSSGGEYSSTSYPAVMIASLGASTHDYFNYAVLGSSLANVSARQAVDFSFYGSNRAANKFIVWTGRNELSTGTSGATEYSALVTYMNSVRAAGFKAYVLTALPATDFSAPEETERLAYNSSIVSNWATFADGLVDVAADSRLQTFTNATYFDSDQIHLVDAGYAVVAGLVGAVVG